jgi:hypothetical protein
MRALNEGHAVAPPEARRGVAEMPKQILAARPLLERLEITGAIADRFA